MPLLSNQQDQDWNAPTFPWLYPTQMATAKAARIQNSVRLGEMDSNTEVTEENVGIATIHARQDLVLVYSMLTDAHSQLVKISRGVWILVGIAIYLTWRLTP